MRFSLLFVLAGCGATSASPGRSPAPADVASLPADSCGRFELTFDKGTPNARPAENVRARCESSYVCTPRVSGHRVEVAGVSPGTTTLHLEFDDPKSGKGHAVDSRITITPAPVRRVRAPADCQYVPLRAGR